MPSFSKRACPRPNGRRRERQRIARLPSPRVLLLGVAGLALAACVPQAPAPPAYLVDAADPDRPVPPLVYRDVTAGTRTFRPVDSAEPKGWEQQNKDAGSEGMGGMSPGGMGGMDHSKMKGMGGGGSGMKMDGMKGMGGQ